MIPRTPPVNPGAIPTTPPVMGMGGSDQAGGGNAGDGGKAGLRRLGGKAGGGKAGGKDHEICCEPQEEKCPPRTFFVNADNTTREGKNQHFATAYHVAMDKFEGYENQFLEVGHTHNEQDQRFSSVGTTLHSAPGSA